MFQRHLATPAILVATLAVLFGTAISARSQGHKFRIPFKKARLPVGMVQGSVTDRHGAPINAVVSVEESEASAPQSLAVPLDPQTGKFKVKLAPGKYKLTAQAEGYVGVALNVEVRDKFRAKVPIKLQKAKPTPEEAAEESTPESVAVRYDRDANLGEELDEDSIRKIELEEALRYGATDTAVPQAGEALLEKLANLMKRDETLVRLVITGHSHKLGDEGLEKRRSERRAVYAKNFLVKAGVDPARLRVQAMGAIDMVASGDDEEARALNDRVNFELWKLK